MTGVDAPNKALFPLSFLPRGPSPRGCRGRGRGRASSRPGRDCPGLRLAALHWWNRCEQNRCPLPPCPLTRGRSRGHVGLHRGPFSACGRTAWPGLAAVSTGAGPQLAAGGAGRARRGTVVALHRALAHLLLERHAMPHRGPPPAPRIARCLALPAEPLLVEQEATRGVSSCPRTRALGATAAQGRCHLPANQRRSTFEASKAKRHRGPAQHHADGGTAWRTEAGA